MRALLHGFRLLTLEAEDAALLPDFLTAKETIELLRYYIRNTLEVKLPETINRCIKKRFQVEDSEEVLISRGELEKALNSNVWSTINNTSETNYILLTTNIDIYITKIECVLGLNNRKIVDKNRYQKSFSTLEASSIHAQIFISQSTNEDNELVQVEATVSSVNYHTVEIVCLKPVLIAKHVPMRLVVRFECQGLNALVPVPWTVFDLTTAGEQTLKCFKQLQFEEKISHRRNVIFIKSFSHRLE
jgi:hypothetical protein